MEHDDLPDLVAGVQIVDQPILERRRLRREWKGDRIARRAVGKQVVEQMWICVEKDEVGVAIVEGIVAHMVDLPFQRLAAIDLGTGAERLYRPWRDVVRP